MTPNRRRWWVNWCLVAAATTSVGAVIFTRNDWTSGERLARATHLVVGFREGEISRIRIGSSAQRLVIERGTAPQSVVDEDSVAERAVSENAEALSPGSLGRWMFVEPYQGDAEEASVDALLRAIEYAPFIRKVDESTLDRRAAGLDAPVQTIELEMGPVRTRIHVGAKAPVPAKSRYVEVGGEGTANKGVYVVSDSTADELLVKPDTFRVRQIVPYGASTLARIELADGDGRVVTLRSDAGDWRLIGNDGSALRIEQGVVDRFFAALSRSRAEHFLASEPAPQPSASPGDSPAATQGQRPVDATFYPKDGGAPLRVRFGGTCPVDTASELAVRSSAPPLFACTTPLHLRTFVEQFPEFIDRGLFGIAADSVEELKVQSGGKVLELARRGEIWSMRQPSAGEVEREAGEAFVGRLLQIRGELGAKPTGDLTLVATVTVLEPSSDAQDQAKETVEVLATSAGTATNAELWVHRLADDAWLRISGQNRRLFEPSALLLRGTQLVNAELEEVTAVRVETRQWTEAFEYSGRSGGCRLREPPQYAADNALCLDVLDELRMLRAKSWVGEHDDGSFGLSEPRLRVTFTQRPHAEHQAAHGEVTQTERTLVVGGHSPDGGFFAALSPDRAVFTLGKPTVEALETLVVDRSSFLLESERLQSLILERGGPDGLSLSFRRLGDELVPVDGRGNVEAEASPQGRWTALIDGLSVLRPEGAVALLPSGQPSSAPERFGFRAPVLEVTARLAADDGSRELHWIIGLGDVYRGVSVYYAMPITTGPSAVFAVPREAVQRILQAM